MSELHIDEFYADAARTLLTLHNVFPRPIQLYVEDICGPDTPDEYGVHGVRYQACLAAILWLGEEGFIRYSDVIRAESVDQAVLTGRCFTALHAKTIDEPQDPALPESIRKQRTSIIYGLAQAVERKSSVEIENALAPLLQIMS